MCGALHRLRNGRVQAARDTRARLVLRHRVAIRNQEAAKRGDVAVRVAWRGRHHARVVRAAPSKGMALPVVLAVMAALLALTAAWFEIALVEARRGVGLASRAIAFRAADAALDACVSAVLRGDHAGGAANGGVSAVDLAEVDGPHASDPARGLAQWRQPGAFDAAAAIRPFAAWPDAAQPPSCVIERGGAPASGELITARGIGATRATVEWLQAQIRVDGERVVRRWRRIVQGGG
jgi:hypothetical protein